MMKIGDCRDDIIIEDIFGSVTDFAQVIERKGDNFIHGKYTIKYNEETDIHSFYI
jgi:hypothetical protein